MERIYPPTYTWEGRDFNKAWEEAVRYCMREGMVIRPEENSNILTRDMCSKITLMGNGIKDILNQKLHLKFPTRKGHCFQYVKEYTREWVNQQKMLPLEKQFVYNYMDRLVNYPLDSHGLRGSLDQLKQLKQELTKGTSRRNQVITWIPITDMMSTSPPCLQRIWIRRLNDKNCEIHFDWRSRDLYGAWQSNYIGLFDMIQREILLPLELEVVKIVDNCNSLHIYQYDWEAALRV